MGYAYLIQRAIFPVLEYIWGYVIVTLKHPTFTLFVFHTILNSGQEINDIAMAKQAKVQKELDPRILEIGNRLETIRKEAGYTSYENFAIDKGIPRMLYWRLEKGTNFTITSLLRVLDANKMTLEEFFKEE